MRQKVVSEFLKETYTSSPLDFDI